MEKELISVIVPVYNIEDYIAQCIESILKQTYSNLEILLVNDGSTDCCPEICDRYAGLDSRIQVIHKSNGGLSSARNSGLNQACGEYIAFIDGDDFIHPEMLEDLYFALKDCDADMSVCNLQYVDENGNPIREYPNHIIQKQVLNAEGVFAKSLERYGYYYVVVWNKLYKKELWETYRFREGKAREDEFSFHHIVRNCRCISCVPNVLYYYVQHTGSIMAEKTAKKELDVIEAYLERMSFFLKENHLQFLVQMDKLCFITLCETKKICKKQKETSRYLDLMRAYQILHGQIAQKVKMPFRIKLKRAVCKFFPYSAELYGKIKETAKEIWYGLSYLSILHQATRIHIFSKHKPCIYLIATPAHGNLGDQAIVYAQYRLLEECGYKKNIIEITRASYEHLRERLKKLIQENDLIIIDGGRGQLSAVKEIFDGMNVSSIELVSLAKREEEVFTLNSAESIKISHRDYSLKMLQRIRDEAHRFAITYFRNLHSKRNLQSVLTEIDGIGKVRRMALLEKFGTLDKIISASVDDLAATEGISRAQAEKIKQYLEENL